MFSYFLTDFSLFLIRFAVGMAFLSYGLNIFVDPKSRKLIFGPKHSNKVLFISLLKIFAGLFLVAGIWSKYAGIALASIAFFKLFFEIFVWKYNFALGWDRTLLLFVGALQIALTGGGNWVIII